MHAFYHLFFFPVLFLLTTEVGQIGNAAQKLLPTRLVLSPAGCLTKHEYNVRNSCAHAVFEVLVFVQIGQIN